jgi:hypothetical protein
VGDRNLGGLSGARQSGGKEEGRRETAEEKGMKKLLIVALLCAIAAGAQVPENRMAEASKTVDIGQAWVGEKIAFIVGFDDARALGGMSDTYWPNASTAGEVMMGVDQFYEDPANTGIQIGSALTVFYWKVKGNTPDELAKYVALLRNVASDQAAKDAAKGK